MASFVSVAKRAYDAVRRVGVSAVFETTVSEDYSPEDGEATVTTRKYTVIVSPPVSRRRSYKAEQLSTTTTTSTIIVPAYGLAFRPSQGNRITIGSDRWTVTGVAGPHQLGDTIIAYELEVARA